MEIKDRVAIGDNRFKLKDLATGEEILVTLTPNPEQVQEAGTAINKGLLQPIVDAVENLTPIKINKDDFIEQTSQSVDTLTTDVFKTGNVISGTLYLSGEFLKVNADEIEQLNILKIKQLFQPKHTIQCVVYAGSDKESPRVRIDTARNVILMFNNETSYDSIVISFTYVCN